MSDKKATASGGVRNLRAMFENKDEATSPPDRGRSPGISSIGGSSTGTSPRPLSKVRTSFVAVENKSGQWGLRRDTSGEPSLAKRRTSFSLDEQENPKATAARKESIVSEMEARKNSTVIEETIPECAVETPSIEMDKQLGAPPKKEESLSKTVAKTNVESKKPGSGAQNGTTNGHAKPKETAAKTEEKSKSSTRPAPISTNKSLAVKSAPKSSKAAPTKVPKTPTSPLKSPRKPASERKPSKAPANNTKSQRRPSHGSVPPPTLRIQPSPPKTGFVKPKPRSPTRPVRLPASLTAHTASSGSKTAVPSPPSRQSLSRASGNAQPIVTRSPSRATGSKTLTRKPSTVNKPASRPSLGPPPNNTLKKQPSRQSLPNNNAPADEGFLARMMRPTTSSASKTAEKLPETPPKRAQSVRRPPTRDGPPKMNDLSKHVPVSKPAKANAPAKHVVKEPAAKKPEAPKTIKKEESRSVKPAPEAKATKAKSASAEPAKSIKSEDVKLEPEVKKESAVEESIVEPVKAEAIKTEEPNVEQSIEEPKEEAKVEEVKKEVDVEEPKEEAKVETPEATNDLVNTPAEVVPSGQSLTEETSVAKAEEPISVSTPENTSVGPTPDITKVEETTSLIPEEEEPKAAIQAPQELSAADEVVPASEVSAEALQTPEEINSKTEVVEDPADIAARAEIARLNAEFMGASPVSEIIRADGKEEMESY